MDITTLTKDFAVAGQLLPEQLAEVAALGFKTIINNRPDAEAADQPSSDAMAATARELNLAYYYLPVIPNQLTADIAEALDDILRQAPAPALAFCRTGNRSSQLFNLRNNLPPSAGSDTQARVESTREVLIVGGGAGGLAAAASLLKRDRQLQITVIEPSDVHYYQPGWTLVGGGVFRQQQTVRQMGSVMPRGVEWIKDAVASFEPDDNAVVLQSGTRLNYQYLVVAPGLKIEWDKIEGLTDTLGSNGVTSNYHFDHAPGTWEKICNLQQGNAVFTQPPMPIKCAGAPQKAMYQAAWYWEQQQRLKNINVHFFNAGGVLFGVPDYVPALESYISRYGIDIHYQHQLVAVDGPARKAFFQTPDTDDRIEVSFDFLHVSPPQCAPDFIAGSPLAGSAGWVDVDQATLQHTRFSNVFSLGDVASTSNAKTAAAVRKQAPVVAHNIVSLKHNRDSVAHYEGYGSCPLIVERGKVILAEFGYGGVLQPTMPSWILNGKQATRLGWILKAHMLPPIYFDMMLKGHEWLATPPVVRAGLNSSIVNEV